MGEPLVELLGRVEHEALALGALLALRHERRVLVALEEAGHLAVGQQRVHALEEAALQHVRLVEHEAQLLVLAAGAAQQLPQVLVKVGRRVLVVHLDLFPVSTRFHFPFSTTKIDSIPGLSWIALGWVRLGKVGLSLFGLSFF